jgi:CxxC-x17-CxxC domain-containing protein
MEYQDRVLKCTDCGSEFVFTAGEQAFYADKGFRNEPKRCKPCKARRADNPGHGSGFQRSETKTSCSQCGKETTVPFKPTQGRPVYCRECFQQRRSMGSPA